MRHSKLEQAARQALEALESCNVGNWSMPFDEFAVVEAITALREALAVSEQRTEEQAEQKQYPIYGFCPICGSRGISRERRIDGNDTCANGHSYASNLALHIAPEKHAEQEPVAWMNDSAPIGVFARHKEGAENFGCTVPLYAAPVRTKDLTDGEINELWLTHGQGQMMYIHEKFAHAVIAADREKNK